ncbi:hypothetical protein BMS3Abin04_02535 [bacterium BMS3Abin04]|nr:hypothetical protein BMS3Abin04_02535 [bacterium BMS3Abin04]
MKKCLLIVLILLCSMVYAQENYKGKISLVFNKKKIELPFNIVSLRKENNIIINARAELNKENIHQLINIQLSLKDLSTNERSIDVSKSFLFEMRNRMSKQQYGNILLLSLDRNTNKSNIRYSEKGYRWKIASFNLSMGLTEISFVENRLIIKGKFNIEAWSEESKEPFKPVVEIKNGKFEIII